MWVYLRPLSHTSIHVGSPFVPRTIRLGLILFFALLTAILYYCVQLSPFTTPEPLPLSAIDTRVPFNPSWLWCTLYQSIYLVVPCIAISMRSSAELRQFWRGYTLILMIGVASFIVWPITCPRPAFDPQHENIGFRFIRSIDGMINCLPSLHVAFSLYSLAHVNKSPNRNRWLLAISAIYFISLSYSTMALKQHYALDVLMGTLTGTFGFFFSQGHLSSVANLHCAYRFRPSSIEISGTNPQSDSAAEMSNVSERPNN